MWLRRYMVDESNKDYVKRARAKGMSEGGVMFKHIFRNAFVPLAQYIPTAFLNTVIGSIYIESLYSIPGMGGLLVTVIKKHDNTMVQGIVLLYACVGVMGLFLGDILMVLLDPRISLSKKEVTDDEAVFLPPYERGRADGQHGTGGKRARHRRMKSCSPSPVLTKRRWSDRLQQLLLLEQHVPGFLKE